jgi:hypothetical protein
MLVLPQFVFTNVRIFKMDVVCEVLVEIRVEKIQLVICGEITVIFFESLFHIRANKIDMTIPSHHQCFAGLYLL